jgi:hypothetical protein
MIDLGKFDLFSMMPSINIRGKKKVHSSLGLSLTALLVGVVIVLFIFFGKELVTRRNPYLAKSDLPAGADGEYFSLSKGEIELAIGFSDEYNYPVKFWYDTSVVELQFYLWQNPPFVQEEQSVLLEMELCRPDFTKAIPYQGNMFCVKKNQKIVKEVLIGMDGKSVLVVSLLLCGSSWGTPTTCASDEIMRHIIEYSGVIVAYREASVDPFNYKEPVLLYSKWNYNDLGMTIGKLATVKFMTQEFVTDHGWLFEDRHKQTNAALDIYENDVYTVNEDLMIYHMVISHSGRKVIYDRKYSKLQDVIAQVTGILTVLVYIFRILTDSYLKLKVYEPIVNKLFIFRESSQSNVNKEIINHENAENQKGQYNTESPDLQNKKVMLEIVKEKKDNQAKSKNKVLPNPHSLPKNLHMEFMSFMSSGTDNENLVQCDQTVTNSPDKKYDQDVKKRAEIGLDLQQINLNEEPERYELSLPEIENQQKSQIISLDDLIEDDNVVVTDYDKNTPCNKNEEDSLRINIDNHSQGRSPELIDLTVRKYLLSFLSPSNEVLLLKEGIKKVEQNLDIYQIVQKLRELECLKQVLLDENQRIIFNNLKLGGLSTSNKSKKRLSPFSEPFQDDKEKLKDSLKTLKNKENLTETDRRLLNLFEHK